MEENQLINYYKEIDFWPKASLLSCTGMYIDYGSIWIVVFTLVVGVLASVRSFYHATRLGNYISIDKNSAAQKYINWNRKEKNESFSLSHPIINGLMYSPAFITIIYSICNFDIWLSVVLGCFLGYALGVMLWAHLMKWRKLPI